jgi:hypothetical protein
MHYLSELANKLADSYRQCNGALAESQAAEERRKLVAAVRCALELETGKGQRDVVLHSGLEYELSEAFSSFETANKE